MKDINNYIWDKKSICPFCNKSIRINTQIECCGHGEYDTVYNVYCDCAEGSCSHFHLGIFYDVKSPYYSNEELNIILAYIDYRKNINKLKERFSNNENK